MSVCKEKGISYRELQNQLHRFTPYTLFFIFGPTANALIRKLGAPKCTISHYIIGILLPQLESLSREGTKLNSNVHISHFPFIFDEDLLSTTKPMI